MNLSSQQSLKQTVRSPAVVPANLVQSNSGPVSQRPGGGVVQTLSNVGSNNSTLQISGAPVNFQLPPVQLENGMTVIPIMHSSVPNVTLATINMSNLVTNSQPIPVVNAISSQGVVPHVSVSGGGYVMANSAAAAPMRLVNVPGTNLPPGALIPEVSVKEECEDDVDQDSVSPAVSIHKVVRPNSTFISTARKSLDHRGVKKPSVPVKCNECDYTCSRQDRLNEHKRVVHQGVRYNCTECDFSTPRKDKLSNHKMVVHQGLRFNCEVCNFSAVRKDKLTHHMNAVHLGVRYPCMLCGFSTPRKDRLKQHVQSIHERIRYPCPICDHQAVRKDKLRDHMLIVHHGFTYKCDLCTHEFTRPDKLKAHKRSQHLVQSPVVTIPNPFINIPIVTTVCSTPTTTAVSANNSQHHHQHQHQHQHQQQHIQTTSTNSNAPAAAAMLQQMQVGNLSQQQLAAVTSQQLAAVTSQQQLAAVTSQQLQPASQSQAFSAAMATVAAAQQEAMHQQLQQQLQQQVASMAASSAAAGGGSGDLVTPQVEISLVSSNNHNSGSTANSIHQHHHQSVQKPALPPSIRHVKS